jgi:hypothetical protein
MWRLLSLSLAAAAAANAAHAAAHAADGWVHVCDGCAATGADCPYLDHADGSSLAACQQGCEAASACNALNFDPAIQDCVLRACADPRNVSTAPDAGYSVWALPSRPQPPPGCWPSAGGGGGGGGDAPPEIADDDPRRPRRHVVIPDRRDVRVRVRVRRGPSPPLLRALVVVVVVVVVV